MHWNSPLGMGGPAMRGLSSDPTSSITSIEVCLGATDDQKTITDRDGRRIWHGRAPWVERCGDCARPFEAQSAAFCAEGKAGHLLVPKRRAFADGHVRSEAHAGQIQWAADARGKPPDRAEDREPVAFAIHH